MSAKVCAVVVTFNRKDLLRGCLKSLLAQSRVLDQIAVIDNHSTDRSGELVKATLMRATLHLVSAREYPSYALATMEGRFGAWRPPGGPGLADLEVLTSSDGVLGAAWLAAVDAFGEGAPRPV